MRRMIKHSTKLMPAVIMSAALVMASCVNDECLENRNSLPLAGFYSSSATPEAIALDTITITGIGVPGDSILHDRESGLSKSYFPFRIDGGTTSYEIKYLTGLLGKYGICDTITFNYETVPWFVSSSCGVIYKYDVTSIVTTHHAIDSVTCPRGVIDNANMENLKIYFRVSSSTEEEEES